MVENRFLWSYMRKLISRRGIGEEEKTFIDKRADVFVVSVLIIIIDFRLFICIDNMKCNWFFFNFFFVYKKDIMLKWLRDSVKILSLILLTIFKCGWRMLQVIDPLWIGFKICLWNQPENRGRVILFNFRYTICQPNLFIIGIWWDCAKKKKKFRNKWLLNLRRWVHNS